jgi:hypothetical protein
MTLYVYNIPSVDLEHFLQGGIVGAGVVGKLFYGLHGKTLNFTAPIGVVAFAAPGGSAQSPLTIQDVKAQIEAAIATLLVTFKDGHIRIGMATPSAGVVLSGAGTANAILGFGTTTPTTGTFFNKPAGGVPEFVMANPLDQGRWQVVTWE